MQKIDFKTNLCTAESRDSARHSCVSHQFALNADPHDAFPKTSLPGRTRCVCETRDRPVLHRRLLPATARAGAEALVVSSKIQVRDQFACGLSTFLVHVVLPRDDDIDFRSGYDNPYRGIL